MRVPAPNETDLLILVTAIRELAAGRSNAATTFTLTSSTTTTVLLTPLASKTCLPFLSPLTANAAAELGAGTIYPSTRAMGSVTFTHANNSQTDRTFAVIIHG